MLLLEVDVLDSESATVPAIHSRDLGPEMSKAASGTARAAFIALMAELARALGR